MYENNKNDYVKLLDFKEAINRLRNSDQESFSRLFNKPLYNSTLFKLGVDTAFDDLEKSIDKSIDEFSNTEIPDIDFKDFEDLGSESNQFF